ncbi:MAG: tubulin-like doman-containing protein [Myxococcota bacterium]
MANQQQAVVEEMLTKPSMVSPTLFVGLGGCGCQIAVRVARHLKRQHDYDERFKDLIKFALVDTNVNDLEKYREDADETFLISNFEKEEYANLAAGKMFLEADDYFTHWVPDDYRFRAGDTAGAGQIRIEARLGCYYQMKHKDFVPRFRRILEELKSHEHGHRRLDTTEIRVVICYSVAGGTGSGSHLPLAYMLRDQANELGKASLYGVSVLPAVFEDKTGANKDGTFANGYAALKELEHMMKLGAPESRFYPEGGLEFHYDPSDETKRKVRQRPFDFVYMIDKPESYSLDSPVDAAADGLYLQFFSPIFAEQASDYDNYTQHQRFLVPHDFEAKGIVGYTQFYGSYGSAVLLVPVDGLVDYCSQAAALSLMRENFLGSIPSDPTYGTLRKNPQPFYEVAESDDADARPVHLSDFHKKEKAVQLQLRDRLFQKRVRLLARCEFDESQAGRFRAIFRHGHRPGAVPTADNDVEIVPERRQKAMVQLAEHGMSYSIGALILDAVSGPAPDQFNPGLLREARRKMKDEAGDRAASQPKPDKQTLAQWKNVASSWKDDIKRTGMRILENGYLRNSTEYPGTEQLVDLSFIKDEANEVSLTAQRYAVLQILDELRDEIAEPRKPAPAEFHDLDEDDKIRDKEAQPIVDKLYDQAVDEAFYEIEMAFAERRAKFRSALRETANTLRKLESGFQEFERNQSKHIEQIRQEGDSSANQYIIDSEALQIENGRRMWDFYYEDKVAPLSELSLGNPRIQQLLSGTVRDLSLRGGGGTSASLNKLFDALADYAADFLDTRIGGDPKANDKSRRYGQTLADALKLEVTYRALYRTNSEEISGNRGQAVRNAVANYRALPDEEKIDLSRDIYQEYLRNKVKRIETEKASLLCSYDESRDQHGGVRPNYVFIGAISEDFEDEVIQEAIQSVETAGIKWVSEGWSDPHKIIFYRSVLNVPMYVFGRMNEMRDYYYRFKNLAKRSKVLHIDKNWEDSLPDLDPDGAQEKHRQEHVRQHIINFGVLLTLSDPFSAHDGYIVHRDGAYLLRSPSRGEAANDNSMTLLGHSLAEAIERLPEVLESEKVKYMPFQQVLQGVRNGLAPGVLRKVVKLPFRWRENRDQLRTQYGTNPSPDQEMKLKDYTDSFYRMQEALEGLLDRLRDMEAEQMTVGGDSVGSNNAGLTEQQARQNLRQSVELLRAFQESWRAMENPEEIRDVPETFRSLFNPLEEDELTQTLETLRTGEFDRD